MVSEGLFVPLKGLISSVGQYWAGVITCLQDNSVNCTLLARWDEGYRDPWLILTDLEPQKAEILWYGMRSWSELPPINRGLPTQSVAFYLGKITSLTLRRSP
jgi:hypothetical protein